jgi:dipeptidyl-peptidase-3
MRLMRLINMLTAFGVAAMLCSCGQGGQKDEPVAQNDDFRYLLDEFADLKVMRYQVPGWDDMTLKQKEYAYHLSEAAKYGRDITWDQYCKWNLPIRHAVEDILNEYNGDRESEDFKNFLVYAKRLFFSNGIHHHYAEDKFFPACSL